MLKKQRELTCNYFFFSRRKTHQIVGVATLSARPSALYCSFSCSCFIQRSALTCTLYWINSILPLASVGRSPAPSSPSPVSSHPPPGISIGNEGTSHQSKLEALSATLPSPCRLVTTARCLCPPPVSLHLQEEWAAPRRPQHQKTLRNE